MTNGEDMMDEGGPPFDPDPPKEIEEETEITPSSWHGTMDSLFKRANELKGTTDNEEVAELCDIIQELIANTGILQLAMAELGQLVGQVMQGLQSQMDGGMMVPSGPGERPKIVVPGLNREQKRAAMKAMRKHN